MHAPVLSVATTVRPAAPTDAALVLEMSRRLSRDEGSAPPRLTTEGFLRDGFGPSPIFTGFLAERAGRVVGYAICCRDYDTDRMTRSVYLVDLFVEPGARGCGVGRSLVGAVAQHGAAYGAGILSWLVLAQNAPARRFYRGIGREIPPLLICSADGAQFDSLLSPSPAEGIAIRPARPSDSPALADMLQALIQELGGEPRDGVEGKLRADGFGPAAAFTCLIAEAHGRPLGYALFWPLYDADLDGRGGLLSDLYVVPDMRGRGLGRALMASVGRTVAGYGGRFLLWQVLKRNLPARAFYRRIAREHPDLIVCISDGAQFAALAATPRSRAPAGTSERGR